jgi:hypothetical protein
MPVVFFITHPDVAIDPSVPVPDCHSMRAGDHARRDLAFRTCPQRMRRDPR